MEKYDIDAILKSKEFAQLVNLNNEFKSANEIVTDLFPNFPNYKTKLHQKYQELMNPLRLAIKRMVL